MAGLLAHCSWFQADQSAQELVAERSWGRGGWDTNPQRLHQVCNLGFCGSCPAPSVPINSCPSSGPHHTPPATVCAQTPSNHVKNTKHDQISAKPHALNPRPPAASFSQAYLSHTTEPAGAATPVGLFEVFCLPARRLTGNRRRCGRVRDLQKRCKSASSQIRRLGGRWDPA